MIFMIIMTPIWSAATKAMAEKNLDWIRKTVKILRGIVFLMFLSQIFLIPIMQPLFNLWLGNKAIVAVAPIEIVFMLNSGIMMNYALLAQVSNGMNELRVQFRLMLLAAVLLLALSYIGTKIVNHYAIVVIAQTLALVPYVIGQSVWINRYLRKKQD